MSRPLRLILTAALLVVSAPAQAHAAPDNDALAAPLRGFFGPQSALTADLAGYSTQAGEPGTKFSPGGCATFTHTAWFALRGNGHSLVFSVAGSEVNIALAVYDPGSAAPVNATRVGCASALAPTDGSLRVDNLRRDHLYLVQAGTPGNPACGNPDACADTGRLRLVVDGVPRPPDDYRAQPDVITTGVGFQRDNSGATLEAGETSTCAGVPYAATLWLRWTAPDIGTAHFTSRAAFTNTSQTSDTVLAVYRASDGQPLGCNNDADEPNGPSVLDLPVAPGDYLIQVGARGAEGSAALGEGPVTVRVDFAPNLDRDGDGFLAILGQDCNDANGAVHPGAVDAPEDGVDADCSGADAVNLDRDGDGYLRGGQDCDDGNRLIHPGAADTPQNGIDEDCRNGDAPYPVLSTQIHGTIGLIGRRHPYLGFTSASADEVPAGSQVTMLCSGRGCQKHRVTRTGRAGSMRLLSLVRGIRMLRGTQVELRVTKPGTIGRAERWVMPKKRGIKTTPLCVHPGSDRAARC